MSGGGLHEERVRVIIHLPHSSANQAKAFRDILKYIKQQRTKAIPVTGYTHSSFRPSVYTGFWWGVPDEQYGQAGAKDTWVRDDIVVLMVDLQMSFQDDRLSDLLARLKNKIFEIYQRHKSQQEEVWIVSHGMFRQL